MNLYQLTNELEAIRLALESGDGEITPEAEKLLDALSDQTNGKIDGVCKMVQEYQRRGDAAKAEADRLGQLASTNRNRSESLKRYLKLCMERLGYRRWSSDLFDVSICKNGKPSIRYIGSLDALPESLKKVSVDFNGSAAYEAWKSGLPLPEGTVVEQGEHLRIR